ncbi:receptor-type tyrosine-protein phosphatase C-like [Ctenocephalides felis]|uniref:receptor-type tyrosine-protein phosphatase C-like n=1 Tax=Ctenocephalides felis TaxID=7515 RepID=UPI000E6E33FD|nr:receptor-type tyrosine-protein phosphatase C-like [Ctenocephalides felis]
MTLKGELGPVLNLAAYSFDGDKLSLRWRDPEITRGATIEKYSITISDENNRNTRTTTVYKSEASCLLWDGYLCSTIKSLDSDVYKIEVRAVSKLYKGDPTVIDNIILEQRKPSAPLNLRVDTDHYDTIVWEHPWIPGGKIKHFQISWALESSELLIHPSSNTFYWNVSVFEDKKQYKFKLKELSPASTYSVKVRACNSFQGEMSEIKLKTPLPVPNLNVKLYATRLVANRIEINIPLDTNSLANSTKNSGYYVVIREPMSDNLSEDKKNYHNRYKFTYKKIFEEAAVAEKYDYVTWIAKRMNIADILIHQKVLIGTNSIDGDFMDFVLSEETDYKISVVFYNTDGENYTYKTLFNEKIIGIKQSSSLWNLLLLLIPILAVVVFVWYKHKKTNAIQNDGTVYNASFPLINKQIILSHPVSEKDFEDYVRRSLLDGTLDKQYKAIPKKFDYSVSNALKLQNRDKNRYIHTLPYDWTSVRLDSLPNDPWSDYINASYIDGFERSKEYIATQGPKENTAYDFWRMILQEKVSVICMLTQLKEKNLDKCFQYWPPIENACKYGNITITNPETTKMSGDYIVRKLLISSKNERSSVLHLHYTDWPDHETTRYADSLVPLLTEFQKISSNDGPKVVHCSAGDGRTGTFILADICVKMARATGKIDVLYYLNQIRKQRAKLVNSENLYKLVHLTVLETLSGKPTAIPCFQLKQTIYQMKDSNTLLDQWRYLDQVSWKDDYITGMKDKPTAKEVLRPENRNTIVAGKKGRVVITRAILANPDSDYINAVLVDGFKTKEQFIVTHFPLEQTIDNYWRMIFDKRVKIVIVFNEVDITDPTVVKFVPTRINQEIQPSPRITIKTLNKNDSDFCTVYDVLVSNEKSPENHSQVKVMQWKGWKSDETLPSGDAPHRTNILVQLWEVVKEAIEESEFEKSPILLTCYDGATACGLFAALVFVIEKMRIDGECDVPLALKTIRKYRKEFVRKEEQYEYLLEAALDYLDKPEDNFMSSHETDTNSVKYLPERSRNLLWEHKLNDNFWQKTNSTKFYFAPRTDSAWNDFEERNMTISKEKILIYFPKYPIDDQEMYISASFKVKSDAHVMFCENEDFSNSKCYMVIISGYNNAKSLIRKCKMGIPPLYPVEESCNKTQIETTHSPLLNDRHWNHFTFSIQKSNSNTEFRVYSQNNETGEIEQILNYKDTMNPFDIKWFGVKTYLEGGNNSSEEQNDTIRTLI